MNITVMYLQSTYPSKQEKNGYNIKCIMSQQQQGERKQRKEKKYVEKTDADTKQIIEESYNREEERVQLYCKPDVWRLIMEVVDSKHLRELHLNKCHITDSDITILSSLNLTHLQTFSLGDNKIGVNGIKDLLKTSWPKLSQLNIQYNNIGNAGLQCILTSPNLPQLTTLVVAMNHINTALVTAQTGDRILPSSCLQFMLDSTVISRLRVLDLGYNNVGSRGLKLLSKASLPQLQQLFLWYCSIDSSGIQHLSKTMLPSLRKLRIAYNNINIDGYSSFNRYKLDSQLFSLLYVRRMDPINTLCFVAAECGKKTNFTYVVYSTKLGQFLKNVLKTRYSR